MDGNKKIKILGIFVILIFTVMACQVHKPNYGSFYVDTSKEVEEAIQEKEASSTKKDEVFHDTKMLTNKEQQYRKFVKDSLYKVRLHALNDSMHDLRIQLDSMQYQVEKEFADEYPRAYIVYPVKEMDYRYDTLASSLDQRQENTIIPSKEIQKVQEKEFQDEIILLESVQTPSPTSTQRQSETTQQAKTTQENSEVKSSTEPKTQSKVPQKETKNVPKQPETVQATSPTSTQRQSETTPQATLTNEKVDVEKRTTTQTQPVVQKKKVTEVASKSETVQVASTAPVQRQSETTPQATLTNEKVDVEKRTTTQTQPVVQERKAKEVTQESLSIQPVAVTTAPNQTKATSNKATKPSVQKKSINDPIAPTVTQVSEAEETNPKPQPTQGVTVTPSARQSEILTPAKMTHATMQTNIKTLDTTQVEKPLPTTNIETKKPMLLTAYYQIGQTQPSNEVVTSLMEVLENNKITKVELAGYTDSTGTVAVNKRITNTRINYIYNKITPLVPIDRIYIQNFGQNFASETRVDEERRVEIRLYME